MAIREVVTVPYPILRRKARKVTNFGPELQNIINDMVETMRQEPGVGLAAPQVNVPLRIIVVEFGDMEDEKIPPKLYTVVNPEIIKPSNDVEVGIEGCLSVPDFVGEVERPVAVTVRGQTRNGQPIKIKAKGWLARIFQHEVDHLNGILFTDLATNIWQPEEEITQVSAA